MIFKTIFEDNTQAIFMCEERGIDIVISKEDSRVYLDCKELNEAQDKLHEKLHTANDISELCADKVVTHMTSFQLSFYEFQMVSSFVNQKIKEYGNE
ncbi:MAG: hypothetical protein FWC41_09550 [Firmicutes bacterium]|nr:hypothetical protein [Bacillota bacterium]